MEYLNDKWQEDLDALNHIFVKYSRIRLILDTGRRELFLGELINKENKFKKDVGIYQKNIKTTAGKWVMNLSSLLKRTRPIETLIIIQVIAKRHHIIQNLIKKRSMKRKFQYWFVFQIKGSHHNIFCLKINQ